MFSCNLAYGGNILFSKLHLGFLNLYYSFDPVYDVLHFSSDTAGILYMLAYHATVFLVWLRAVLLGREKEGRRWQASYLRGCK